MGESMGPNGQPGLRRSTCFDASTDIRGLLHGSMIGRGAQVKSDAQEATVPASGELMVYHCAGSATKQEIRKIYRLTTAKGDTVDCQEKTQMVSFNEETMRARKKRIRGSAAYSCHSTLMFYTGRSLVPDLVPEKKRTVYQGYNTGDVIGFVEAVQPSGQWLATRPLKEKVLGGTAMKLTPGEDVGHLIACFRLKGVYFPIFLLALVPAQA